jgi:hypothetical protein
MERTCSMASYCVVCMAECGTHKTCTNACKQELYRQRKKKRNRGRKIKSCKRYVSGSRRVTPTASGKRNTGSRP